MIKRTKDISGRRSKIGENYDIILFLYAIPTALAIFIPPNNSIFIIIKGLCGFLAAFGMYIFSIFSVYYFSIKGGSENIYTFAIKTQLYIAALWVPALIYLNFTFHEKMNLRGVMNLCNISATIIECVFLCVLIFKLLSKNFNSPPI